MSTATESIRPSAQANVAAPNIVKFPGAQLSVLQMLKTADAACGELQLSVIAIACAIYALFRSWSVISGVEVGVPVQSWVAASVNTGMCLAGVIQGVGVLRSTVSMRRIGSYLLCGFFLYRASVGFIHGCGSDPIVFSVLAASAALLHLRLPRTGEN